MSKNIIILNTKHGYKVLNNGHFIGFRFNENSAIALGAKVAKILGGAVIAENGFYLSAKEVQALA